MKRNYKSRNLIMWIISGFIILACLLFPILKTNAWFTSGDNQQIQIILEISNINLQVYQKLPGETGEGTLIKTYEENNEEQEKSYINLTDSSNNAVREILPDTEYSLNLTLKNADTGSASIFVRYKIGMFINGETDTLIDLNIIGASAPNGTTAGFELNSDGYYYYRNSSSNQRYPSQANLNMLTAFSIPYSEFINATNDINADSVKLVVTIEGFDVDPSLTNWYKTKKEECYGK